MINEPLYDGDLINLGYLNTRLTDTNELIFEKSQNFGTVPNPPYKKYDTYMGPDGIYICVNGRNFGEYNAADWTKASTYVNVGDAFTQGIITAGMLQAVNGGTNTAGLTGEGTGDSSIRFWAGSTYANRGSAPFMVTQGGAITASNIAITGGSLTWNNLNKPTKSDLGTWTTYIDNNGIYTGTLTANQVNAVEINANSITTGTLSTSRLNSDVITTSNFSAQNIDADKITSGTIKGLNAYFGSGYSGGEMVYYNGSGFIRAGGLSNVHPYVSALNVALFGDGSGGISFRNGTGRNNPGSQIGYISLNSSNAMYISSNGTVNINRTGGNVGIQDVVFNGNNLSTSGGADITIGSHLTLRSANSSYGVYARGLNVTSNSSVTTSAGQASSQNVKTNIEKFNNNRYSKALNILSELEMYDYDYKYSLYKKNKQYGFIIDEIEQIEGYEEFFDFYKSEAIIEEENGLNFAVDDDLPGERIEVKQYQPDVLDKYLLTVCKALQFKINDLEERIKKLEEGGR